MAQFKHIEPHDITKNMFTAIGRDWMLITAGKADGPVNTMTASWGGVGEIWGKKAAYIVIRPQRYTKEFVDGADTFSLSFMNPEHKEQMGYLGRVSGRDEDKIAQSGLTLAYEQETPYFEEAGLVFICKKLYRQEMMPECFLEDGIDQMWYRDGDYHTLYIAEILQVLEK